MIVDVVVVVVVDVVVVVVDNTFPHRVLLLPLLALLCACPSRGGEDARPGVGKTGGAPAATEQDLLDSLSRGRTGLLFKSSTQVRVARGSAVVTIGDEKELRRPASGDFDLTMRRTHTGSEAGDTEESSRAILFGRDYYTRGSGGPFVKWDDMHDEPALAMRSTVSDTLQILGLALSCADFQGSGSKMFLSMRPGECQATPQAGSRFSASLRDISGEQETRPDNTKSFSLKLRMRVESGGNQADVEVVHRAEASDLPAGSMVTPPRDWIDSRRERPLKMIENVLSGLVTNWGPGAPPER